MRLRPKWLTIAVVMTLLDTVVTIYYGTAVWVAWSGDILARGLLVLLAAVGATSLANVWVQTGSSMRARAEGIQPIAAEMRGQSDV